MKHTIITLCSLAITALPVLSQDHAQEEKKAPAKFSWFSQEPEKRQNKLGVPSEHLNHQSYESDLLKTKVGYYIYLPKEYKEDSQKRYPVVYYLHGGRPGREGKSLVISKFVHEAIEKEVIEPTIYVFANGGPVSWYDFPEMEKGLGESTFTQELIPHIDAQYRTIAKREGRGIEGFSQGGRGTTRFWLKHPELFISAAPGGSGYGPEMHIRDNEGLEKNGTRISPTTNNTWDLLDEYADDMSSAKIEPLFWVGPRGFNYETNLLFMETMKTLGLAHQKVIAKDIGHNASKIYELHGETIMKYHQARFQR